MPDYCYTTKEGLTFERFFPMGKAPEKAELDPGGSVWGQRDIAAEHTLGRLGGGYPYFSDAAGVHPDQVPEAMEHARKYGMNMSFHTDGRVKFDSANQRKQYCELIGLYDRNGGYGDPRRRKAIESDAPQPNELWNGEM